MLGNKLLTTELVKNFQEDTHIFINPVKQLDFEEKQKESEWNLER